MRRVPAVTRLIPSPDPTLAGCRHHVGAGLVPARYGFLPQTMGAHEGRPYGRNGGNVDSSSRMASYALTLTAGQDSVAPGYGV